MSTQTQTPEIATASTLAVSLNEGQELLHLYADRFARRAQLMAEAKAAAEPLTKELDSLTAALTHWADNNPLAFGGKKMLKLEAGELGYKAGVKKVALPLDLDTKKYLETVRKVMPTAIDEEVNARAIIGGWDHIEGLATKLGRLGVSIVQNDNFIITPKK